MHGNVWEWCRDWSTKTLPSGTDPEITKKAYARIIRGGAWNSAAEACPSANRCGGRIGQLDQGFRLAAIQVISE